MKTHQTAQNETKDTYILGGADLEMVRIEQRLHQFGANVLNTLETWETADVAHHANSIQGVLNQGNTPVGIELRGANTMPDLVDIDHHGENSKRDASITQVLKRLGVEPNLIDKIIAANDSHYIPGMEALLDSEYMERFVQKRGNDEFATARYNAVKKRIIDTVRRKDRQVQGVTEEMESEAEQALKSMEQRESGMRVVRLNGNRTSPVNDRLYSSSDQGNENLVVVCCNNEDVREVWYYGAGDLCKATVEHFSELKAQRVRDIEGEPERRGIYHTVGGGPGYGEKGQSARCLVVAEDPYDVIEYIESMELNNE